VGGHLPGYRMSDPTTYLKFVVRGAVTDLGQRARTFRVTRAGTGRVTRPALGHSRHPAEVGRSGRTIWDVAPIRAAPVASERRDPSSSGTEACLATEARTALREYPVATFAVGGSVGTEAMFGDGADDGGTARFGVFEVSVQVVHVDEW